MAESMQDIKRRIKSVEGTKKITKAMELVASAKLRKSRELLDQTRPYYKTIVKSIQEVLSNTKGVRHPMLVEREVKRVAYIVITADRGLCGGYNANILKMTEHHIAENATKENVDLLVVGQRGRDFFKRRGYNLINSYLHISEEPTFADASRISNEIVRLYEAGEIDEVYLSYTRFDSTISTTPNTVKLLPAESVESEKVELEEDEELTDQVLYEPSPEAVLSYLIPKYIKSFIFGALLESSSSQQSARRLAMESATDNAEEMISDLKLHYNRARQAAITQEISEIVGGAEALN
ncbi:MAG: ATP synthase F1 subunit gamma [Tissierellales bacterium]|jgi:F-type H+-transporting ATPase subunit gamma|nr:ATP synthase F1 subunit gamma [Tissierellales bacterium]